MAGRRGKSLQDLVRSKSREELLRDPQISKAVQDADQRMKNYQGMSEAQLFQELLRMRGDPSVQSSIQSGQLAASLERLMPVLDDAQKKRLQDILAQMQLS